MKDIFFDLSVRSVRLNYLRSILASIGIVIGVIAISTMGMLGTNMQLQTKDQLSAGANTIVITPDAVRMGPPGSSPSSSSSSSVITKTQLAKIKLAAGSNASNVIPIYSTNTEFTLSSTPGRGTIYGINPEVITSFLTIEEGTNLEGANDALVGSTIASNFNLKIGSKIKIGSTKSGSRPEVKIVGILKERGQAADSVRTDNAIVVSDEWYTKEYGGEDEYPQVNVIVKDVDTITGTEQVIDAKLNTNQKTPVVRVSDASTMLSSITSTLSTMTTFILAIGGISLLVAATSIFNVMMMSVTERVQEIGILLSIGTETGEVRRMFLYEAFILGILGAVIGGVGSLIIGYSVVSYMIGTTEYFFLPDSIIYVPAGMLIGIIVCVISGLYPAWRASNMDPIDALRSE
ncbi:ABC transporter permease [uncultured Methanoregula sp.]|uniref:ABC transporter permease n=1 Tax=uncultured Methanoregula sp. TaxID=1005933 RepID=UPI002AAB27AE|nr:ABC transporter permease [uncultured Methanoregula sp.]